jgi:hypothetical protein
MSDDFWDAFLKKFQKQSRITDQDRRNDEENTYFLCINCHYANECLWQVNKRGGCILCCEIRVY